MLTVTRYAVTIIYILGNESHHNHVLLAGLVAGWLAVLLVGCTAAGCVADWLCCWLAVLLV